MSSIPKNNLKERMMKLGYRPDIVQIKPPVLDNSKVAKPSEFPKRESYYTPQPSDFTPPVIVNLDDWSDFEDD